MRERESKTNIIACITSYTNVIQTEGLSKKLIFRCDLKN